MSELLDKLREYTESAHNCTIEDIEDQHFGRPDGGPVVRMADIERIVIEHERDTGWVSFKERLPSNSKAQLVRFEDAVFEYGHARYFDGEWRGESGMTRPYDVTHWRPLPAPPKEAADG